MLGLPEGRGGDALTFSKFCLHGVADDLERLF